MRARLLSPVRSGFPVALTCLCLGVLAVPSLLHAQARVVADLVTEASNLGSEPVPLLEVGDEILVAADDGVHGLEPWLITAAGEARLLADLCAGRCSSIDPYDHQTVLAEDGRVYFLADDGQSNPDNFWQSRPTLWVSDLTEAGTRLLSDEAYLNVKELRAFGEGVVFAGNNFAGDGEELWMSNGTPEGTRQVADVHPSGSSRPRGFVSVSSTQTGSTLFFSAITPDEGREWWRWTEDGSTELVVDLCPGTCEGAYYNPSLPRDFDVIRAGDRWLFVGYSDARDDQLSLWGTDGTAAGTQRLLDEFRAGLQLTIPVFFEVGDLIFAQRGDELWTSDGTSGGTSKFADLPTDFGSVSALVPLGTDPEPTLLVDGASQLLALRPGMPRQVVADGGFLEFISLGDRVVFRGVSGLHTVSADSLGLESLDGLELPDHSPRNPIRSFGDRIFLSAGDAAGQEPWISDGTASGTHRLVDLRGPRADSNPTELHALGDRLVFLAETRTEAVFPETASELWTTVGLGAERLLVGGSPKDLELVGDRLFFQVYSPERGYEPWISDGTVEGTRSLGDLEPGSESSFAREPVLLNGKIYFFADRRGDTLRGGQKLWVTDGTAGGTRQVIDIDPAYQNCHPGIGCNNEILPRDMRVVGDRLIFAADQDGLSRSRLWRSDGTTSGTGPIYGGGPEFEFADPTDFHSDDHTFYFVGTDPSGLFYLWGTDHQFVQPPRQLALYQYLQSPPIAGIDGWISFARYFELLVSDGSAAGSGLVDIPYGLTHPRLAMDQQVFFSSADSLGEGRIGGELWVTDGTTFGTRLVAEIRPGLETSGLRDFVTDGDYLYFTADDGETGHEIWRSDGDTVERLTDLAPGPATAAPSDLTLVGSQLYFAADSNFGRELWAMPKDGQAGCTRTPTHHCLADGRFRVGTRWRVPATGEEGVGRVVDADGAGTDDTGYFYFFGSDNVEFAVKVLDATTFNDHHWVFTGALTDVEVWLDVYDTVTGQEKTWHRPPGDLCGFADVEAFPEPPKAPGNSALDNTVAAPIDLPKPVSASTSLDSSDKGNKEGKCETDDTTLCLHDRFEVRVQWHQDGQLFQARAVPFTDETGQFWFFGDENVEVILKVLDARTLNDHWWVFHGVLTNLPLEIEVTDTVEGRTWTESTAGGPLCGGADTSALPG